MLPLVLLLLLSLSPPLLASLLASIPDDLYAFPKYRVSFLTGLPVSNQTAERWLRDGLQGGLAEFLEQPTPDPLHGIDSPAAANLNSQERQHSFTSDHQSRDYTSASEPSPVLEHMRLGPSKSYLCLIPPAPTLPSPSPDDPHSVLTPSHSWSLLQPLSGTCLYHRQAWFTYAYCHNLHVRQFRELPATFPHPPGARTVEEDPEWEAFTLGKAPTTPSAEGDLAVNDQFATANNLELARQAAGQRYLVQRWSDGTVCDKTGRPREIEIQFHCSMTMTDTILFVKEARTCEYVLVIHTPRLCGEPGFKSRLEQMPETAIRCREILDNVDAVDRVLPLEAQSAYPLKRKMRPPISRPLPAEAEMGADTDADATVEDRTVAHDAASLLRQALQSLVGHTDAADVLDEMTVFEVRQGDDGEIYLTMDTGQLTQSGQTEHAGGDREGVHEHEGVQPRQRQQPVAKGRGRSIAEALRAAGYEIKGQKKKSKEEVFTEEDGDDDQKRKD